MACNLERPDPQVLFDYHKNNFSNTVLGGATVIPESNEFYVVALNYAMSETFYALSEQAWKEQDPRVACLDNLVDMASIDGVYPNPAIPAQGYLKLTGTAGAALDTNGTLSFTVDGQTYVTANDTTAPTVLDGNGNAVVRVRAVLPGADGNVTATAGTLDTTLTNVNTAVEVCGGQFCNGADAETEEEFRARYLIRLRETPRSTHSWIINKFLEWPCVTRAHLREGTCCGECGNGNCQECRGYAQYYVLLDSTFNYGIPTESIRAEIEEWMFGFPQGFGLGQVEMGVCGAVATVTPVLVNVAVAIQDCVGASQIAVAESIVQEYFASAEPSKEASISSLTSSLERVLGADVDVTFTLNTEADGYGPQVRSQNDNTKVFVTPCGMEPDCDYLLVLNDLTVLASGTSTGDCPA